MTADDQLVQEERPFHVVLVDIKKAAEEGEIVCVEKPLMDSGDLKFVAISYRWGEVQETTIDTQVGYLAQITSFDLDDFLKLCMAMQEEIDLRRMQYVWVDAICVDQTNHARRKATIYQMTHIYERANYILAVPDLHISYLQHSSQKYTDIIRGSIKYNVYLYYLIHGDIGKLYREDFLFLCDWRVPENRTLRHMLYKHTDYFTDAFLECKHRHAFYDPQVALQHICDTNPSSRKSVKPFKSAFRCPKEGMNLDTLDMGALHGCNNLKECPLSVNDSEKGTCFYGKYLHSDDEQDRIDVWKSAIHERAGNIRQSMDFMADLIRDWSMRVWVISEYHIAKKKDSKKMKYWFMQLCHERSCVASFLHYKMTTFFEFDFDDNTNGDHQDKCLVTYYGRHDANAVYKTYHETVRQQLTQQTFLEMILKSRASRNDDRFHAILPSSDYRHLLVSKDKVDSFWRVNSLVAVKLELYEWMCIKDKLELLFLSGHASNMGTTLPTFATCNIHWPERNRYPTFFTDNHLPCNFDLSNPSTVVLSHHGSYQLRIKPIEYYLKGEYRALPMVIDSKQQSTLLRLLQLDVPKEDLRDMVCISNFGHHIIKAYMDTSEDWRPAYVFLLGSFAKNKWILIQHHMVSSTVEMNMWSHHYCDEDFVGFDIY